MRKPGARRCCCKAPRKSRRPSTLSRPLPTGATPAGEAWRHHNGRHHGPSPQTPPGPGHSSDFLPGTESVLVCLLTTTHRDAPLYRLSLPAGAATGLHQDSQVMVDEIRAVRRDRCGAPVGRIDAGDAAGAGAAARLRHRHRGLKRDRG
ncbi:type II toxin-antitoxin system PemK/MazF family toxin [Rhodopila globiformis]|uniref:type II toxin-antitoxin system PemK/MazF family toxin n=1 Tax=Rhodopila globiformis TaxID=1071 RepID=UPI0038D089C3